MPDALVWECRPTRPRRSQDFGTSAIQPAHAGEQTRIITKIRGSNLTTVTSESYLKNIGCIATLLAGFHPT